jgi:hypothetical protein
MNIDCDRQQQDRDDQRGDGSEDSHHGLLQRSRLRRLSRRARGAIERHRGFRRAGARGGSMPAIRALGDQLVERQVEQVVAAFWSTRILDDEPSTDCIMSR